MSTPDTTTSAISIARSAIPQDKLLELEAKYGRIGVVTHHDGKSWAIVLRKPKRAEYKLFRANVNNPARAPEAQETLVKQTCVFPDANGLEAMLEDWPGIPEAAGKMLSELAGLAGIEQGNV